MTTHQSDIIIIGAGPGGYDIAAEAARDGMKVTLIERAELGGTCLNRGCIPTKCLCATAATVAAVNRAASMGVITAPAQVDYATATSRMRSVIDRLRDGIAMLLRDVEVVKGEARFVAGPAVAVGDDVYTAPKIIIATGSRPAMLPVEGASLAVTSDEVLALTELPRRICIIGGGVIGMEFAGILSACSSEVTVLEYCQEILPPFDREVAKRLRTTLSRKGVKIIVGANVTEIKEGMSVTYTGKKGQASVDCDLVVMAVGRRPVVPEGIEEAGIRLTGRGYIATDDDFCTSAEGVYAVGDVNGRCMLAHAATAQARVAMGFEVDLSHIPSAVFTMPECAMVGLTEEQCREASLSFGVSKAMFAANGKALAMDEGEGFVKVIYDKDSRKMLGCHIIGPHAADIIAEATAFMADGTNIDEIAYGVVHGHPTLSETLAAACAAAE